MPAVSWQFLVNNKVGGALDTTNLGKYDQLMQDCLATGATCAIDIHNFARVNRGIIGQGGPPDAQFADLWSQLATKYKSNTKVIFGLMNEPHDLDVPTWSNTVQAAVTAIRNAGASAQMILLPGTNFSSAGQFVSSGSAAALINVKNPDGSTTGLVLDLHKYLDVDNSGTHAECTTDNIADAFQLAADFLRQNGRQALVSETGAGNTPSCFTDFCAQNIFINQNSDVFLGYIAWAAGSFSTSYLLSLTPSKQNGKFVDQALASQCVIAPWLNAAAASVTTAPVASAAAINAPGSSAGGATSLTTRTSMATFTRTVTMSLGSANATVGVVGITNANATALATGPTQTFTPLRSTGGADVVRNGSGLLLGTLIFAAALL